MSLTVMDETDRVILNMREIKFTPNINMILQLNLGSCRIIDVIVKGADLDMFLVTVEILE